MITIDVPAADRVAGQLSAVPRQTAIDALDTDGVVVLNDVIEPAHLDERLMSDLTELQARPDAPYNWTAGNIQQDPPPFPPYLFADVLLNDLVISVPRRCSARV